ncbi:hypothetical protein BN946_scf184970.g52 [Trametes cinnabarina]|uniref:RNA-directed DNA polymerase n=1 Tax=Pycnoporus cinnabarinus TaxID=5643 RepID=A0A060SCW0_PYCCI|nr:hypothetical protein BN946_scf184970.g52 [Trametes cinnabarina]
MLDDRRSFSVQALLDSGCTGSSIDVDFVRRNHIPTRKLPRPIPVYNADNTLNKGGPISEYVEGIVRIGDHSERMTLAVTSLGKSDIFIGYEWLRFHNPEIDWHSQTIKFDRCPDQCGYQARMVSPDDDDEPYDPSAHLEPGESILAVDMAPRISHHIRARSTAAQQIAEEQHKQKEQRTFEEIVPPHYHDFKDVFDKESFDELPEHRPWDHAIELIPGAKLTDCKVYPLSPEEQKQLDEFLEENLRSGRIRPSKSPMASPFFFVKKKDGKLRPVQDYCKLNDITVKNRYPLPLVQDLINKLKRARYFTKLDIRWGYNNVRIRPGDEWKAAFRTNRGLFEPLVMFFGLTNSPATFQSMMNDLFRNLINRGVVIIYLDDILIFTRTLEEHRRVVREVLQILRENKLYLKDEKCEFERTKIEYLGMIISEGRVAMDPAKVAGIREWPVPCCKRELQSFLGFTNFYRRFIRDYGDIAKPLTALTGNIEWHWGPTQAQAFAALKSAICSAPVLAIPTDNDPYRLECDASNYAVGAVLSQRQDGVWHPIAFLSKAMSSTERNYEIYDKELLAIMTALDEFRHYLMGAAQPFEIWTDHKNLEYYRKPQKLNRRQARWVSELANYQFTLHHKPGKTNIKSDLLSRRADHDRGDNDNADVVVLKDEWFQRVTEYRLEGEEEDILRRIRRNRGNRDRTVEKALACKEPGWKEDEEGLVTWKGRLYVPKDRHLRERIIRMNHDSVSAGHPGRYKTQELVTRDYWWPRLQGDIRRYIEGCEVCQRTKARHGKINAPLHPHDVPTENWEVISIDMVGALPESEGYDAILNVVDLRSKQLIAIPCNVELSAEGWAQLFFQHVYRRKGLPRKVISDRGPQFVSRFLKALYELLGIKGNPSTPYHPQTDGQTERVNQEIEQYLRIFINHRQNDWVRWLPIAEFCYNDRVHASTGYSPFYLNSGRHPWKGTTPRRPVRNETAQEFVDRVNRIREEAASAMRAAQEQMKRFHDRRRGEPREYQPGDRVWLEGVHIKTDRPMKKLDDKRYGPFKIVQKVGASAYRLAIPRTWRGVHPVVNESLLTPYVPPAFPSQARPDPPPPIVVDGLERWDIEEIVNSKRERGRLYYHIRWKDRPRSEWQWLTAAETRKYPGAIDLIATFHRDHPTAPRPLVIRLPPRHNAPLTIRIPPRPASSSDREDAILREGVMS